MTCGPAARLLAAHALAATAMSMPWPVLLASVFDATHRDGWVGLTGAGRMLPYVALSALAGLLADRVDRTAVLRWSSGVRTLSLGGSAVALGSGQLALAVGLAVLTVAAGTPAYPAAVAALPRLAPGRPDRWTAWLVTIEVSAFVIGPALGGVLLGAGGGEWTLPAAAVLSAVALVPLLGLRGGPAEVVAGDVRGHRLATVLRASGVPAAIAVVALVNFAEAVASVGLLGLSEVRWLAGEQGFGVATAALGFGALAAPLLGRLVAGAGSLRLAGAGLAGAGLAPLPGVAAAPLALVGAASTTVECVATQTLQRGVPDRVRAFALGLTDSVMVSAAALGALVAPSLVTLLGPVPTFVALGALLAVAAVRRRRPSDQLRERRSGSGRRESAGDQAEKAGVRLSRRP